MDWIRIFNSEEEGFQRVAQKQIVALKYKDRRLCIIRSKDKFYVSDSVCPHMGANLSEGRMNDFSELICPLHEYRFNLEAGGECNNNCRALRVYACKQDQTGVYFRIE